jgi:hypothetical protein
MQLHLLNEDGVLRVRRMRMLGCRQGDPAVVALINLTAGRRLRRLSLGG